MTFAQATLAAVTAAIYAAATLYDLGCRRGWRRFP